MGDGGAVSDNRKICPIMSRPMIYPGVSVESDYGVVKELAAIPCAELECACAEYREGRRSKGEVEGQEYFNGCGLMAGWAAVRR